MTPPPLSDRIRIQIKGRGYDLEFPGLTPLEAETLAGQVESKMREIENELKLPDTTRQGALTALAFAVELHALKIRYDRLVNTVSSRTGSIRKILESALNL